MERMNGNTSETDQNMEELEKRFLQTLKQNNITVWDYDICNKKNIEYHMGQGSGDIAAMLENPEMIHEEDAAKYQLLYRRIDEGEKQVSAEIRVWSQTKQEYIWLLIIFTVVKDKDGKPVRAICSGRDISYEKQIEQSYFEEVRYREEAASSMIATCRTNLTKGVVEEVIVSGKKVPVPREAQHLVDYKDRWDYYVGVDGISDEDNEKLTAKNLIREYKRGNNTISIEYSATDSVDKRPMRIRVDAKVLKRPETGDLISFFYERNVTEEYCTRNITNSIIQNDHDLVGTVFADSGFVFSCSGKRDTLLPELVCDDYDAECERFLREYGCGENLDETIRQMQIPYVVEQLAGKEQYVVEFSMREADGSVRRKEERFSYADRDEGLIAFSRRDVEDMVQEEKRKQEQLERAREAAERANSAKSEFLSRMSHEMRTPMNAITGLLALAEQEVGNPDAMRDYLEKIEVSSHYLLNLINDVLDMSKIESGELKLRPEICNYQIFAEETAAMIRPLCEQKNITFLEENQKVEAVLYTDKLRFKQVLMNILSNAVKFTPEGGTIYFRSRAVIKDGFLSADYEIADTGIGISHKFQETMFCPFTQEQREIVAATQGTGLGLAIAKAVVDQLGGNMRVLSDTNQGTQFFIHVKFPLAEPGKRIPGVERRRHKRAVSLRGKRVLLVEDHPLNQLIAKRILQNSGVEVFTADNGAECLKVLSESQNGYFDAVLMDIRMPVMDGLTATEKIRAMERKDCREVPIIAMTANAFEEDVKRTKEAGMNAHLAKPIEPALMLETLADCIAKRMSGGQR